MKEVILLKYGELVLKGLNRSTFGYKLLDRVKKLLAEIDGEFETEYAQSTLCIRCSENADVDAAISAMQRVFGVVSVCRGFECAKDIDEIKSIITQNIDVLVGNARTFKCEAKRSDKRFALTSPQICAICGETVLSLCDGIRVDVQAPESVIWIEIRDKAAFVHGNALKGAGGLPTGTAGKGLLLLSGGIDSPVAGHMIAKRGMDIDAVYFESPPYTSEAAKQKVISLATKLSDYCGRIYLHSVSVTEIQETLVKNCEERLFTLLLRRFMMRIACRIAMSIGSACLITGESIGQVASQTVASLTVTNDVSILPVFRPCCGLDKEEIVVRAREIGTFDTSILPYEDCCTVFTPKHPNVNPTVAMLEAEEAKIDVEGLIARALATDEYIKIG